MRDMKEFNTSYSKNNQENTQDSAASNDSKPVFKSGVLWKLFRKPCRKLYCFGVLIIRLDYLAIISCCYITWAALPITTIIIGKLNPLCKIKLIINTMLY